MIIKLDTYEKGPLTCYCCHRDVSASEMFQFTPVYEDYPKYLCCQCVKYVRCQGVKDIEVSQA